MKPLAIAKVLPWLTAGLAASVVFSQAEEIGRTDIAGELVGKHIVWWEEAGWRHGHLFLMPGGQAEITVDRPESTGDVGRWHLDGDTLCTQWSTIRSGAEKCYRISRGDDGLFLTTGGNVFEIRELGV